MSKHSRHPPERERIIRYEVRREREIGTMPAIEQFLGLDRARLAALSYALDGPTYTGQRFTGQLTIHRVTYIQGKICLSELIDVIDERVAFRLLHEMRLPRADKMATTTEQFQRELDAIEYMGT
ncbi:hypothetical protein [Sphingorhabdus lacus]|uniref:hypothetical protein n=1 Tax=Sphingorhabdus lacus TaxID=392610 RepID=UPI0035933796